MPIESAPIVAFLDRDGLALGFLGGVLLLVLWQVVQGMRKGVIWAPGKRRIFRVARKSAPVSYWGAVGFYGVVIVCLLLAAGSILRERIWPPPGAPLHVTAIALGHSQVELSWLSPDRRTPPDSYAIYRSTQPGGASVDDYQLLSTVSASPWIDRTAQPATRYYYRVAANYPEEEPAFSEEASTVTGAAPAVEAP